MKKGAIIAGVAVAAVAAVAAVRLMKPKDTAIEVPLPVVEATNPQTGSIELYRSLIGSVEPADVVYVYPKMAGEVTEVFVKAGDTVSEGQPICTIDTKQVDGARLSLESAEIALKDAQTNLTRMQALFAAGDISSQSYESAQTQAKSAQIQYDSAKLAYDNQVEYSNITAVIAGTIESVDIEVHDNVSGQNLICVISGAGGKAVNFSVPEKIAKQLNEGDVIRIEKNGSEYQGTITEISTMIDDSTGLFKIKASVEDGDALPTGSSAKLYVSSDKAENVMTLPVDCIYYSGGNAYVYTFDNGTVHRIPVEIGIYDSEIAEVVSGIGMDDLVITTWSSELFEGSQVQLASDAAETTAETETSAE